MIFGGAKETIDSIGTTVDKTGKALDSLFTSDEERLSHKEIMERIKLKPAEWAHELNVISAKSNNWFNSGWRPALGWVGAIGMALYFIPQYVLGAFLWLQVNWGAEVLTAYPVSPDGLWQLVSVLLGGAAFRTYEKQKGINS